MRINVNDPQGELVDAIYLNNKRLAMCIEADDEEGWVKVLLPPKGLVLKEASDTRSKIGDSFNGKAYMGNPIDPGEWKEKTLHGEVDIVMREITGLEDKGLNT